VKLVSYTSDSKTRIGALLPGGIIDLHGAAEEYARLTDDIGGPDITDHLPHGRMIDLLRGGADALKTLQQALTFFQDTAINEVKHPAVSTELLPLDEVTLLAPVIHPGKIVCVGMNYPNPELAGSAGAPQYPVLFLKAASSLTGHQQPIRIPRVAKEVLYEGELALVIGKPGKYINKENAFEHIAGYIIANDVGARDLEARTSQWTSGKIADTFCPLGPALVTRDEIPDPNDLLIRTTLNGLSVQHGNTSDMIFDVPFLISYISELTTLEIGDLILTGSPKRNRGAADPRIPMHPGDVVSVEIENLGTLTNPVLAEEQ